MRARDALACALLVGCDSPSGPPPVTRLELHAVPTIVEQCDGRLTAWTVTVLETAESHTSTCEQAIVVSELEPYEHYTLQIVGYSFQGLCWTGKCPVTPLPGLDIAECSDAVTDVCADAGGP